MALADWNRDGRVDLIVGNIQGEVWFLPNASRDGQLLFGPKQPLRAQGDEINLGGDAGPLVADWDGDGVPDLLVGADDGSVTLYKGSGREGVPVLSGAVTLIPGLDKSARRTIDLERDPKTGEIDPPRLERPSIRPKLAVYDWNGDGELDLVVGDAIATRGPEPILKDEQKRERDNLEKQHKTIGQEISKRISEAEAQARRDLGQGEIGNGDSDTQQSVAEAVDEVLLKDAHYRELRMKSDAIWKKLRPLKADYSTHGFVWVYLRNPGTKPASK